MRSVEVSAKTRKDAIQKALDQLGAELHEVAIEILDEGSRGLFGFGARDVKVRVVAEGLPDLPAARPARPRRPEQAERPRRAEAPARSEREQRPARNERPARPAQAARTPERTPNREKPAPQDRPPRRERPAASAPRTMPEPAPPVVLSEEARKQCEHTGAEAGSLLQETIRLMGIEAVVTCEVETDGNICLKVQSPDSAILIGRKGRNLSAMEYLINRMTASGENSESGERLTIDVEGYLERRRASLEEMAHRMAEKVKSTGKEVRLPPLSSQERRLVHLVLQEDPDVRTFSLGNAAFRSVIIAPKTQAEGSRDDRPKRSSRGGSRRGGSRRRRSGSNGPRPEHSSEEAPPSREGESVAGAAHES